MANNTPQIIGASTVQYDDQKARTVTETGRPIRRRISSIETARSLLNRTIEMFKVDAWRHARIQGQKDGTPPYDQARIEELGLGYLTNLNFLEMASILNQKASAFYELFHEVPTIATFSKVPGLPEQFDEYAKVVEGEFHRMLFDWSGFLPMMDKVRRDADAFGVGVAVWPDEWDWRPKAFNCGAFYYDPNAKLDPESMEYFLLVDNDTTAGQLYRWAFDDPKAAAVAGWNQAAVKQLLIEVFYAGAQQENGSTSDGVSMWEALQEKMRTGNWGQEVKEFDRVKLVHLYVKEVESGKLSHYIFPEMTVVGKDGTKDGFLYKSEDSIEKVANALWFLPYDCGDGYLKSVRGLASYIEGHCDLSNRYLGRVFDAGFMSASLLLQPGTGGDYTNSQMIRVGVMTLLPAGLNVIQRSTMAPDIGGLLPLRKLSIDIMMNNTGVWRQHPEVIAENEVQKTARQVAEESGKEARLEKAATQFDYGYLERLYREIWRRATSPRYLESPAERPGRSEARDLVDRIARRGVPPEIARDLSRFFVLSITRAIGMGSWGLKLDISNQVVNASAAFDERGRRNAMRDRIAVLVGYQNVDRYVPSVDRDTLPTDETSHAVLENNDIMEGSNVQASSDQWHVTHLQVHVPLIVQIVKAVEAGQMQDPRRLLAILQAAVPHVNDHRLYIANDPTRAQIAQETETVLKQALPVIKKLAAEVQKIQQAEAKIREREGQVVQDAQDALKSREQELEAMEIQGKLENERVKQDSLNQMRRDKTAEQNQINRSKADAEIRLKAERQAAEIELDRQKAAQERKP